MNERKVEPISVKLPDRSKINITLKELALAFWTFAEHEGLMTIEAWGFDHDTYLGRSTIMSFSGAYDEELGKRRALIAEFHGFAARSQNSRLGGDPIILWISGDGVEKFQVAAVPEEERTITFCRVKRWEAGVAYW